MITIKVTGLTEIMRNMDNLITKLEKIDISDEGKIFENEYMRRIFIKGRKTNNSRITYANGKFTNKKGKILYDTGFLFNHIEIKHPKNEFIIAIDDSTKKIDSIEKRFGQIFAAQKSEIKRLKELIRRKILKAL